MFGVMHSRRSARSGAGQMAEAENSLEQMPDNRLPRQIGKTESVEGVNTSAIAEIKSVESFNTLAIANSSESAALTLAAAADRWR